MIFGSLSEDLLKMILQRLQEIYSEILTNRATGKQSSRSLSLSSHTHTHTHARTHTCTHTRARLRLSLSHILIVSIHIYCSYVSLSLLSLCLQYSGVKDGTSHRSPATSGGMFPREPIHSRARQQTCVWQHELHHLLLHEGRGGGR